MKINKKTLKEIILNPGFIILGLILLFGVIIQSYFLDDFERIKEIILLYGFLAPLVFIFLIVLGIVFAPISGYLIWLPGFYIFGPEKAIIYAIIGGLIGGSIAFLMARRWGRPIVTKFVGKKEMAKIDEFTNELGIETLWVLRIFGGSFFDLISYAAGLTNLSFKNFFMITFFGSLPMDLLVYLLVKDTQNVVAVTTKAGIVSFLGMLISLFLLIWIRGRKR